LKIAVVTFPGSNCDADAVHVAKNVLGVPTVPVWHKDTTLPDRTDVVILPGGFSYGDALRSGALARFSPIMEAVRAHATRGGFVFGICNGMQVLVEAGLLPGAMLQNASRKFVCREVTIEVKTNSSAFTNAMKLGQTLRVPVAHHEGCYYANEEQLRRLFGEDRVVFTYRDNPNGSIRDIAGLLNERRNVLGMMPHPERASEKILGSDDGLLVFESLRRAAEARA
jgi:phosphoribosylformylglycinamidine synthase